MLQRNTCRNPWHNLLDVRLAKIIPTVSGHAVEMNADVFNILRLLNFLHEDLGLVRITAVTEQPSLLRVAAFDTANDRFRYAFAPLSANNRTDTMASRWRIQLGARYVF